MPRPPDSAATTSGSWSRSRPGLLLRPAGLATLPAAVPLFLSRSRQFPGAGVGFPLGARAAPHGQEFRRHSDFPLEHVAMFRWVPGIAWSDHLSFWRQGYRALMVTDTAFYRYRYYHTPDDTPDKLTYPAVRMRDRGPVPLLRCNGGAGAVRPPPWRSSDAGRRSQASGGRDRGGGRLYVAMARLGGDTSRHMRRVSMDLPGLMPHALRDFGPRAFPTFFRPGSPRCRAAVAPLSSLASAPPSLPRLDLDDRRSTTAPPASHRLPWGESPEIGDDPGSSRAMTRWWYWQAPARFAHAGRMRRSSG